MPPNSRHTTPHSPNQTAMVEITSPSDAQLMLYILCRNSREFWAERPTQQSPTQGHWSKENSLTLDAVESMRGCLYRKLVKVICRWFALALSRKLNFDGKRGHKIAPDEFVNGNYCDAMVVIKLGDANWPTRVVVVTRINKH